MPNDLHRAAVDDAIDRVARDMTGGAPSAAFRGGVIARLESARPARRSWPWVAAGVAAMAVIVIAVFAVWPQRPHSVQSTVTMTTARAPIVVAPAPAQTPANDATASRAPSSSSSSQRRVPAASPFEPTLAGLPPIERPDPITQESIQPERLTIPQLRIDAIVMPPVSDDGSGRE